MLCSVVTNSPQVCALPASRVARLPFLNKQAAMHNVAIIPDHPRHYHPQPAAHDGACSAPASPRRPADDHAPSPHRPASCPPALSPFAASAAEPASASPSSATPSSRCSLSPAASHNGALAAPGRAARLASAVRRRLSSLAGGGGSSLSLCSAGGADSGSDCSSSSSPSSPEPSPQQDEAGWRGDDEEEEEGGDIVREMVAWINVPAPSDEFYVRLMRKAERDAEAWVRSSGLAARLAGQPAGSPGAAGAA